MAAHAESRDHPLWPLISTVISFIESAPFIRIIDSAEQQGESIIKRGLQWPMYYDWVSNESQKLFYLVGRLRERRDNIPVYRYIIDKQRGGTR